MRWMVIFLPVCVLIQTGCKLNRAYTNGQEGLETTYKAKQVTAQVDVFDAGMATGMHASINYSPLNKLGVFYDLKAAYFQHQYHTIGIGYYLSNYKKYELTVPKLSITNIEIGRHLDFYGGMSYGFTKDANVPLAPDYTSFPIINYSYDLNYFGRRYFLQMGGHVKSKFISFDGILRQVWLDPDKIEIYGLGPDNHFDPADDFLPNGRRSYTEFAFKMNFISYFKPFYLGFVMRSGKDGNFTTGAFSPSIVFLGINTDIYHFFSKNAKKRTDLEYNYQE